MKTIEELQQEIEDSEKENGLPECSLSDLMYRELIEASEGDMAMMMFLDICIDYFNCYDKIDMMYELWESMVRDEYTPTFDAFHSYMVHEDKPRYMPTCENELNAVLDGRSEWKRSCEKTQNEMVAKFGVEWLSASGEERMWMMMKDMQDNPIQLPKPTEEEIQRFNDEIANHKNNVKNDDDGMDYTDLPF